MQSASMGNFPIFVHPSCPDDKVDNCKWKQTDRAIKWDRKSPKARPGYFSIVLDNGLQAEMTVTNRSALYRFNFDDAGDNLNPVILMDLMDLPQSRSRGAVSVDPSTGRFTANGTFSPSFGTGTYKSYFCADFKGAKVRDVGTWDGDGAKPKQTTTEIGGSAVSRSAGAFVRLNAPAKGKPILARVGVSLVSEKQACSNAEKEQPDFDFDGTVTAAEKAWREKLSPVSVDASGVSSDLQTVFWSGLYRTLISPQDYTGENPLWKSDEPYYDSFYW